MSNEPAFTNHAYQAFLDEEKLMGSRCIDTGEIFVPPRAMCPNSYSTNMEWVGVSGEGTLKAFTAIHIGPTAMVEAGYDRFNPYCTGVVQLAEGPLISGQILGVDAKNPESIVIGTPLRVTFIKRAHGEGTRNFLAFETLED